MDVRIEKRTNNFTGLVAKSNFSLLIGPIKINNEKTLYYEHPKNGFSEFKTHPQHTDVKSRTKFVKMYDI